MKNLLTMLLVGSCGLVFAAPAVESSGACMQYHKQMMANHEAIDAAYHKNDACTMGKLMIQNRQMFESHTSCFPKMEKMMGQMQKPVPAPSN